MKSTAPILALAGLTIATALNPRSTPINGTLQLASFKTVSQYGMTVLSFTFSDPHNTHVVKGGCSVTMTRRIDQDLCGNPNTDYNIQTSRGGVAGNWPMNITINGGPNYEYAFWGTVANINPASKGSSLTCTTNGGVETCTSSKAIGMPYYFGADGVEERRK